MLVITGIITPRDDNDLHTFSCCVRVTSEWVTRRMCMCGRVLCVVVFSSSPECLRSRLSGLYRVVNDDTSYELTVSCKLLLSCRRHERNEFTVVVSLFCTTKRTTILAVIFSLCAPLTFTISSLGGGKSSHVPYCYTQILLVWLPTFSRSI
jgi:hypothetical protein